MNLPRHPAINPKTPSTANPQLFPWQSTHKKQPSPPPQPVSARSASQTGFMVLTSPPGPTLTILAEPKKTEKSAKGITPNAPQETVMVTPDISPSNGTAAVTPATQIADQPRPHQARVTAATPTASSTKLNRRTQWSQALFLYLLRLMILGIGLGTLAGTVLAHIDLTTLESAPESTEVDGAEDNSTLSLPADVFRTPLNDNLQTDQLGRALPPLREKFATLASAYPQLHPGAFFLDLDNLAYADFNGSTSYAAASTIKIPVLIAFFEALDAGDVQLDETLTMSKEIIGSGSGSMQYQPVDSEFSALHTAKQMIVISDNTATNMLIHRLGGKEALNQRFRTWGLEHTVINNPLPDLEGTNTTSPRDLSYLLLKVSQGELLSVRSRDWVLGIMRETKTRTLLPQGLESGAVISHKTGDIGTSLGDAGLIDMTNGKRYVGAVLVKRPHNDYSARKLIQDMSRQAYQHFKYYEPRPAKSVAPNPSEP